MTTITQQTHALPENADLFFGLLDDVGNTELVINRHDTWFTRRDGIYRVEPTGFASRDDYVYVLNYLLAYAGVAERIDGSVAEIEATYVTDQVHARIHIVCPPVAYEPALTIAKQRAVRYSLVDIVDNDTLNQEAGEFLRACVHGKLNLVVSGGGGSGKTTVLNAVLSEVPPDERLVIVQDHPELLLVHQNTTYLETKAVGAGAVPWMRPEQLNGLRAQWAQELAAADAHSEEWTDAHFWQWAGRRLNQLGSTASREKVTLRQLVQASLRMRSARIIVGEVRGSEIVDLLKAMNSGYSGSATTLHASSAREAVQKMEMLSQEDHQFTLEFVRMMIGSAVDVIVHLAPATRGRHRVTEILEVETTATGTVPPLRELFQYDRSTDTLVRVTHPSTALRHRLQDGGLI